MLKDINKNILDFLNSIQSYSEIYKNHKVTNSYRNILNNKIKTKKFKNILLDGGFYNLGYLYRLQLFRAAINSEDSNEHAFIWDCNTYTCKHTLKSIGLKNISTLKDYFTEENKKEAELIAQNINSKEELIKYTFPNEVPGLFLYDVILKAQKTATVNIKDENLKKYIYKYISAIKFSEDIIKNFKPEIIALSHAISYQCAPLAWIAAKKKIPVLILYGEYGVPRLWRLSKPKDIFYGIGHPTKKNLTELDSKKINELSKIGERYISKRISGLTKDIGGKNAFQKNIGKLTLKYDRNKYKKKIAIYLGNWFDFPHIYGMSRFIDILDWIKETINYAKKNKNILWIIKPHPLDDWYGGLTLKDVLNEKLPSNIILLPNNYSGKSVMEEADALVTYHGTSALEYASMGKPVMVTDKGWYHDCDFVKFPESKEAYLNYLTKDWFNFINLDRTQKNAKLFAGLYFGVPRWQKHGILPDDADRNLLRVFLPNFIKENSLILKKEIKFIREWIDSESIDYHTYKMKNSKKYTI